LGKGRDEWIPSCKLKCVERKEQPLANREGKTRKSQDSPEGYVVINAGRLMEFDEGKNRLGNSRRLETPCLEEPLQLRASRELLKSRVENTAELNRPNDQQKKEVMGRCGAL